MVKKADEKFCWWVAEGGGEYGCTLPIKQTPLHASGFQTVISEDFHAFVYERVNPL